jgi:hypothetical protein
METAAMKRQWITAKLKNEKTSAVHRRQDTTRRQQVGASFKGEWPARRALG